MSLCPFVVVVDLGLAAFLADFFLELFVDTVWSVAQRISDFQARRTDKSMAGACEEEGKEDCKKETVKAHSDRKIVFGAQVNLGIVPK